MRSTRIHERLKLHEIGDTAKGRSAINTAIIRRLINLKSADDAVINQTHSDFSNLQPDVDSVDSQLRKTSAYMNARGGEFENKKGKPAHAAAMKAYRKDKSKIKQPEQRKKPASRSLDKLAWSSRINKKLPPQGQVPFHDHPSKN